MRQAGLVLALAGLAVPALAQPSAVQVQHAWARDPAGSDTAAVYMTLRNSAGPDQLTSVTSDAAGIALLQDSVNDRGVVGMRPVNEVPLPAAGTVVLRPGGLHVTLLDLNRALKPGDTFGVTLTFEHTAPVAAPVQVLPPGSPGLAAH